jgi:hypothetical protein
MNNRLRSRKLSRRRNTSRRKGSLKKKSKMMKGGDKPLHRTSIKIMFVLKKKVAGEKYLNIMADFGGILPKTEYTVYFGDGAVDQIAYKGKPWNYLRNNAPSVGDAKKGTKLKFGSINYLPDFQYGTGISQIYNKIYYLKDRLCEYYGTETNY